ncbi:MAG: hypothetical protein ABL973_18570 [Micropepsaceae bacterium]
MKNPNFSAALVTACTIFAATAFPLAHADSTESATTQAGHIVKANQQPAAYAAIPLQGPTTQGAGAELSRIIDVVVTAPSPTDAYSVSLKSNDEKCSVSVDVKDGTKTIALTSSRTDVAPGHWTITDKTTSSERDAITTAISKAFSVAGTGTSLTSATSSAAKRN